MAGRATAGLHWEGGLFDAEHPSVRRADAAPRHRRAAPATAGAVVVWAVMTPDPEGRVGLPPVARRALGAGTGGVAVRAAARGAVLALRVARDGNGAGAPLVVDGRGRVPLPAWWRRACAGGACAVATRTAARVGEAPLVVLAPTGVLDGLADVLVGERR